MTRRCVAALCMAAVLPAAGQDLPGDKPIRRYLKARAAELEREFLPGLRNRDDFERARPALRDAYFDMLGLKPLPERTPLDAVVTGRLDFPNFAVEKVHFQSRPRLYVTGNLYLPKPLDGKRPAVLYVCGHWRQERDGHKTALQDHGIWFATHGYVSLIIDSTELGEITCTHHGTYSERRWWWQSEGYTPAGVECWNGMRAIDYLVSRPEVDPARIGVTGMSGGGAATWWIAAADERVGACAPLSGMADLDYYVGEDGSNGHCDCMFLYNRARWNWTTIAALVAPRAALFVNSDADPIFPMPANERIGNRLERLYAWFGAGDAFETFVSVGGHAYRADIRRGVFEFFNRRLRGDARPVEDPDAGLGPDGKPRIPTRDLRVFAEDKDIPADAMNARIDREFVAPAQVAPPEPGAFETWRKDLLDRLKAAAFAAWPANPPGAAAPDFGDRPLDAAEATEDGLDVHWRWRPGKAGRGRRWLVVLNPEDRGSDIPSWARETVGDAPALLLETRGVGAWAWTRKNPPNTVERSMALLGGTVDGGRVWDAITVARRHAAGGDPWWVIGRGSAGVIGAYAALYEPAIAGVVCLDPPPSHRPKGGGVEPPEKDGGPYGPVFLNVLRILDIPEALGCVAPRPLVLAGAQDVAFDKTAAIYKAAGAANKLERR